MYHSSEIHATLDGHKVLRVSVKEDHLEVVESRFCL